MLMKELLSEAARPASAIKASDIIKNARKEFGESKSTSYAEDTFPIGKVKGELPFTSREISVYLRDQKSIYGMAAILVHANVPAAVLEKILAASNGGEKIANGIRRWLAAYALMHTNSTDEMVHKAATKHYGRNAVFAALRDKRLKQEDLKALILSDEFHDDAVGHPKAKNIKFTDQEEAMMKKRNGDRDYKKQYIDNMTGKLDIYRP